MFLGGIERPEAVVQRCSVKQLFLKISKNLQENISVRGPFLVKLRQRLQLYSKRESGTGFSL